MRSDAKRPTAGSNRRRAGGLGRLGIGALLAFAALLALAPLSQAKVVVYGFGQTNPSGTFFEGLGGQVDIRPGLAINGSGNGAAAGTIYVSDQNRLHRFGPEGDFERVWGDGVDKGSSGGGFEICTVAADCGPGSGGSPLSSNGSYYAATVNQATGDVYVHPDNRRIIQFDADGNFIRAWGRDVIQSGKPGDLGNVFEVCEVAADCKAGNTGVLGGYFGAQEPHNMAFDAAGHLWVPDPSNRRIQEFEADGTFVAAHGYNVDAAGGGGELESCTVAADCQAGTQGSALGQFSADSPRNIALDSGGNLYAIDAGNARVQRFDSAMTTATDFAPATFDAFTTTAPTRIAATQGGTGLAFALDNDVSADEFQIVEIDPADGSVTDESLVGAGIKPAFGDFAIEGLAENAATGALYFTLPGLVQGVDILLRIFELGDPLPAQTASIGPAATTDTTATFSADVDPKGGLVECTFQYSTDKASWTDVAAPGCLGLERNGGPQEVGSPTVTGLDPDQTYFVRLRTSRPLVPGSTLTSGLAAFETEAVPPAVTDLGAIQVADTSARLVATIDPRNSTTAYVFEYGTTPALGSSTAPVQIGGGTTPITVSQVVGGLAKDSDHYFRVAATNLTATTTTPLSTFRTRALPFPAANPPGGCPNGGLRQEQGSSWLPDCRAYEMVSPPDKNQGSVTQFFFQSYQFAYARDGEAAGFCTNAVFGDPPAEVGSLCGPYLSRRTLATPTGWQTSSPFPRYCHVDRNGFEGAMKPLYLDANFEHAVFNYPDSDACPLGKLDPTAPEPSNNIYRQDLTATPPAFDFLRAGPGNDGGVLFGASPDFSHVLYLSNANQTEPPDSPAPGNFAKVYDWEAQGHGACATPGGCLKLASVKPDGTPFTTASSAAGSLGGMPVTSGVSDDGHRIYFTNGSGAAKELYLRENGATTLHVSASECTVECGAQQSRDDLVWASPAGDVALFISCDKLTDASAPSKSCGGGGTFAGSGNGMKLYRWERNAPEGNRITDLTLDEEPGDGVQPNFVGFIGASDDGEDVYFVTGGLSASNGGQIVAGEPAGKGMRLFRSSWNGGAPAVDYLAPYVSDPMGSFAINETTLDFTDPNGGSEHGRQLRVTPDGEHLTIRTPLALDPAGDRDPDADIYRWSEAEGWTCVSCQLPGAPSGGDATAFRPLHSAGTFSELTSIEADITMSDDGKRVFFTTQDALVPQDTNGEAGCPVVRQDLLSGNGSLHACTDVYQWHDGTLRLISSGTGTNGAALIGATASGDSVFFVTDARLVGWDPDFANDLYVARVGGGRPEPRPTPPQCEGEGCREEATEAPETTGAGTAVFQGAGNPKPEASGRRCPANRLRRGKRCLTVAAIARKRCRRLQGQAKRRCVRNQARRLRRAQRRAKRRAQRRIHAHRANAYRRATR